MKEHSWSLFTFPVMDIKAAQELLDRRAEEGWTLDRVYLGSFARFVPAESREIWAVDWVRYDKGERQDYLALCQEAGWTFVQRVGSFHLYRAAPGAVPIQTDPDEELRRFRSEVLRNLARSWAILAGIVLILAALLLWLGTSPAELLLQVLLSNTGMLFFLTFPLLLAGGVAWFLRLALRLRQWRRAAEEGTPLPGPGPASVRAAVWLSLAARLWLLILFALFLLDILTEGDVGNALGLFIGSLVGLSYARKREEKAGRTVPKSSRSTAVIYGVILAAALACPLLRPVMDTIPPASPLAEGTFWPGADRLDQDFGGDFLRPTSLELEPVDEGSLGLRHQHWWEFRGEEQLIADCYTARWEWLSRLVLALKLESWYPPLDGFSGAWLHQADLGGGDVESQLLLKGGRSVLEIYGRDRPLDRGDIRRAQELMEGEA